MKINKKSKSSSWKKILIAALIVLVCAGAYTAYASNQSIWPFESKDSSTTTGTVTNNDQVTNDSDDSNSSTDSDTSTSSDNPDKTSTGNQSSNDGKLDVSITSATQNGNILQIRTLIDKALTSGMCDFSLTRGGKTITKSADIQTLPSTATCKGFDIDTSTLSAGSWNITVTVTSDESTGTATKTVNLR